MSGGVMVLTGEKLARRQQIEIRIEAYRDNATSSLLEIGRQLNAAKDEGVVPHGEWGAWVAEHAFMSERTAQAWMQAARELPPGSPLERLGIAKIRTLLTLPAGDREETAEKIGAQELSSREVEEKVRAIRAERDEALRLVGEHKKRLREMAQEKSALVTDVRKQVEAEQSREIHRLAAAAKSAETDRLRIELQLDGTREALEAANASARRLQQELCQEKMRNAAPAPEQAKRIAQLEEQLRARENEIDRLSDQLDEAQTAAMRGGMASGGERPNPATTILSAIGALMAEAGRAPGELARMMGTVDMETRQLLIGQARLTGQWAAQILAVCGEAFDDV